MAFSTSIFQVPKHPNEQYQIQVRHRPSVLDNVDHWQEFEDDKQINRFMEMSGEFESLKLDQENMFEKEEIAKLNPEYLTQLAGKDII